MVGQQVEDTLTKINLLKSANLQKSSKISGQPLFNLKDTVAGNEKSQLVNPLAVMKPLPVVNHSGTNI